MPLYLRIRLTEREKEELLELKQATLTPQRTKIRIESLILSDCGLSVKQIARIVEQNEMTIRRTIKKWIDQGKEGLFEQPRAGRPRKWQAEDMEYLEACLEREERTYNSQQLAQKLKEERKIELSAERIRKILKKKEWRWKRTRVSLQGKRKESEYLVKKTDLETLKLYESEGYIKLKYLDEAGFSLWSQASYSYAKKGKQKKINQKKKKGKRLSILGIYREGESFEYGLKLGSFKSKCYIEMIDWQANKAEDNLKKTGQITVMVLDNYAVHKSREVRKHLARWREQGLEFFFIAAYSPELNIIEPEWHQLKTHELAGRMFDDEYDLAIAVMSGVEKRSANNNCICERFRFNSFAKNKDEK